ncbi:hypothetical protein PENTCL1PPCAC_14065 [Pristionchus entomophagus]|uniref:Dehydrogenase n=1 Tax=Pristionchus entomophagus TaxID=358040 RepID=A0AAV5TFK2_9BILA|nr:hypothetical protein PENTCL1PPCAC_14065 [Pristionchus entomophagus]
MRTRINRVCIFNCRSRKDFAVACKVLEGNEFNKLLIVNYALDDEAASHISEIIKSYKVEHLTLCVSTVSSMNPVKILETLSTLVRCICISQQLNPRVSPDANYLFGILNGDWGSIILGLFSRKIDKLYLENSLFPEYMSRASADELRQAWWLGLGLGLSKKKFLNMSSEVTDDR